MYGKMLTEIIPFMGISATHLVPSLHGKEKGKKWKQWQSSSYWALKSLQNCDCINKIRGEFLLGSKAMKNLDSLLKSKNITLPTKVHTLKTMVFSVFMYGCELDHKKGRTLKNWCFWAVLLEKNLESPLDSKKIKPVNPKEHQPWIFIGKTDA